MVRFRPKAPHAGVAQLAEQLICNQQVVGSSPITGSTTKSISYGQIPERPNGSDCKSDVFDFGGSNPPLPTNNDLNRATDSGRYFFEFSPLNRLVCSQLLWQRIDDKLSDKLTQNCRLDKNFQLLPPSYPLPL